MRTVTMRGRCALSLQPLEVRLGGGLIEGVRPLDQLDEDIWLAPGFVDLQVNGYGGCDLNADNLTEDAVIALARKLIALGTTAYLPTIITAGEGKIAHAVRTIAHARHSDKHIAAAIPGIHLEGPHIAPDDGARGAHPREHVCEPDIAAFNRWQSAAEGLIRLVTLSPHWTGAPAYIRELTARGVRVAIGHTHATSQQLSASVEAGAALSTHLGNGIAAMLPRHPNPLWSQLADDRLYASFIADGHHLPPETMKVMLRAKTVERSILVSDSVALGGMPSGVYDTSIGGRVELEADGRLRIIGTTLLAGAALPLKDDVAWLLRQGLCSLSDAVRMAATTPADFIGMPRPYVVGSPAHLMTFRMDQATGDLVILSAVCANIHSRKETD
jgi:N-acetylglucosamine-6-phosphate deacetylase